MSIWKTFHNFVNINFDNDTFIYDQFLDACRAGDVELVNLFLLINPSFNDNAAMFWASNHGHVGVVDRLLQDGSELGSGSYIFEKASLIGSVAVVERLLQNKRAVPTISALHWACINGHIDVVNRLLQEPDILMNKNKLYASLYAACRHGHIAVVDRLLQEDSVESSITNASTLYFPIEQGFIDIVDLLLQDFRIDPTKFILIPLGTMIYTPIWLAYYFKNDAIINRLLQDPRIKLEIKLDDLYDTNT
jgi:hypothetical protein